MNASVHKMRTRWARSNENPTKSFVRVSGDGNQLPNWGD
jgi:hypothetical protein